MIKEVSVILMGVFIALVLVVSNGIYLLYQAEDPLNLISGNSIKETITGFYEVSSVNHRAFILLQFILLVLIILFIFVIIRKLKSKAKLSKFDFIKNSGAKSGTDLDVLYEILKSKKEINIDDIGKVFKVNLDIALEWSKILEDGNLAMIAYPRFGKPVLKLSEKDNGNESVPKENIKNKKDIEPGKVKEETKNASHKDAVPTKKIITQKNIPKKEIGKKLKIGKRVKKKVKKKKVRRKSYKR